jgi:hypothetical protein
MIVILKGEQSNGDKYTRFGGIACDVEGCAAFEPPFERADRREALIERGWFIAPGQHRCPEHYHTDVPGREPEHREADVTTKVI